MSPLLAKVWRRFIKPTGFLEVHDDIGDIPKKLKLIPDCGYKLIEYFIVPRLCIFVMQRN